MKNANANGNGPIKLSEHWADGKFYGFRKFIKGNHFTLGRDRALAEQRAITAARLADLAASKPGWTGKLTRHFFAFITSTKKSKCSPIRVEPSRP